MSSAHQFQVNESTPCSLVICFIQCFCQNSKFAFVLTGPFRPCDSLLGSWLVRVGLWSISLVSVLGNSLLLLSLFGSPGHLSPLRFTVASMGTSNLLTGMCTGTLALVDALTLGEFGHHGAIGKGVRGVRPQAGFGCLHLRPACFC